MNTGTDVGTFHGAVISGTSASSATKNISENISENVSKNISHICAIETAKSTIAAGSTAALLKCSVTKLVVLSTFVCIT